MTTYHGTVLYIWLAVDFVSIILYIMMERLYFSLARELAVQLQQKQCSAQYCTSTRFNVVESFFVLVEHIRKVETLHRTICKSESYLAWLAQTRD